MLDKKDKTEFDEVIVPDLTFWATGSAVLMTGATPIVVDVDTETCCSDVSKAEEAIMDKTKAIIPVYNYGTAPDMDKLLSLLKNATSIYGGFGFGRS